MPTKKTTSTKTRATDAAIPAETLAEQGAASGGEPDFFEQIQAFSADEWQAGLKIYVYRTWPVIDKRDENHFLSKISEPFDEDYLLRHFGSGKYYLRLNNRSGETINSKTVSIHNPAYPPKVSPDEVVQTDPRNERYFKAWPVTAQPASAAGETAALHELSKLATKALEQRESVAAPDGEQAGLTATLVKWALEQTTKERDSSDPTRITGLLKELKALLPQQQPADGLALVERVLSVAGKLNPARVEAQAEDPLTYVDKVLSLADKLRPAQSSVTTPNGGNLADVAAIVHEVSALLKDPLTIAAQVWAASKARSVAGAPATARTQPQPTAPTAAPLPVESQGGPAHADASQPSADTAPPGPPPQLIALANQITPVMLRWLFADVPGAQQGADFAAFVCDGWGLEELRLVQSIGAAGIVELYQNSPFWVTIAGVEAKFREFVEGFVGWKPDDDDKPETQETDLTSA
jgi:hypothetical protein